MKKIILVIAFFATVVCAFAESSNNDCFWYGRCVYGEFDKSGQELTESTTRYLYPKYEDCLFEIQFDYAQNYKDAKIPVEIYLNERGSNIGRVSSLKLGRLYRELSSSVEYKSDGINLFLREGDVYDNQYQLTLMRDGTILLYQYSYENGAPRYLNCRIFEPDFFEGVLSVRYEVQLEKLKNINWGKYKSNSQNPSSGAKQKCVCSACNGRGIIGGSRRCPMCNGRGRI